jgi:hypothetical protein
MKLSEFNLLNKELKVQECDANEAKFMFTAWFKKRNKQ